MNSPAERIFPIIAHVGEIPVFLEEYSLDSLRQELVKAGCCTLAEVIPLSGMRVNLLPVFEGEALAGVTALVIKDDVWPGIPEAFQVSGTADALSRTIRESVSNVFDTMDSAATKADFLLAEWVKGGFDRIATENYRMLRIAENISEYAKMQSGYARVGRAGLDLGDLLENMETALLVMGEQAGVPIQITLPLEPCWVSADRSLLELAFFNILHNSLHYTREGNEIQVSVRQKKLTVDIIIRDKGLGIPENAQRDIWRPYYTYRHSGYSVGVGLGLAVVKSVAAAYGGSCQLRSKHGEGTTVTLTMPNPTLSTTVNLRQREGRSLARDRFSRLYVGLSDTLEYTASKFRE